MIHVVTEAGDHEAQAGEGPELLPPSGVHQAAVHHLGYSKRVSPVVVDNLGA